MVTVKIFHGYEVKRFKFESVQDLTHDNLHHLWKENFRSLTEEHCFKYFDDEGDLCTLTKSTFKDAFSTAFTRKPISPSSQPPQASATAETVEGSSLIAKPGVDGGEEEIFHLFACERVSVPTTTLWNQREFPWLKSRPEAMAKRRLEIRSREVHPGITCDGCETVPMIGTRYRCNECVDFDLCASCYDAPPTEDVLEHVADHDFIQMSSMDTIRERRRGMSGIPLAFGGDKTQQGETTGQVSPARENASPLSPRVGSEWTEVSIGAPHVEGLLRAFGVDVDSAREAVRKFITTGDFKDIVEQMGNLRTVAIAEAVRTPSTSIGSQ